VPFEKTKKEKNERTENEKNQKYLMGVIRCNSITNCVHVILLRQNFALHNFLERTRTIV